MAAEKMVTVAQIKMIYGVARKLGMTDDILHARVAAATEQEHLRALTMRQAAELIDGLTGVDTSKRRRQDRPLDRASQGQINRILALARKLGWLEGEDGRDSYVRVNGFLRARYGAERLDWLTPDKATLCIEALKAMVAGGRGERRAKKGC